MLNAETYNAAVSQVRNMTPVPAAVRIIEMLTGARVHRGLHVARVAAGTGPTFLTARLGIYRGHVQLLLILLCAFALKLFYSTASANQLRWILAPTTKLVELVTGTDFTFESNAGYMSSDHTFLIASSCAGVNFLMTSFLMLSLRRLWRDRWQQLSWQFIPITALLAYLATLIANTFRITVALQLRSTTASFKTWLAPDQLHRFEGIFIYFGFLLLLFVVSEKLATGSDRVSATSLDILKGNEESRVRLARLLRQSLFPLLIYYATTLALPLATAAYRADAAANDFWEHLAFVLATPLLLIIPLAACQLLRSKRLGREVGR